VSEFERVWRPAAFQRKTHASFPPQLSLHRASSGLGALKSSTATVTAVVRATLSGTLWPHVTAKFTLFTESSGQLMILKDPLEARMAAHGMLRPAPHSAPAAGCWLLHRSVPISLS